MGALQHHCTKFKLRFENTRNFNLRKDGNAKATLKTSIAYRKVSRYSLAQYKDGMLHSKDFDKAKILR